MAASFISDNADLGSRTQSSRLAEFGGRGMPFDICRGTLGTRVKRKELNPYCNHRRTRYPQELSAWVAGYAPSSGFDCN
jgi:hypothetical protein